MTETAAGQIWPHLPSDKSALIAAGVDIMEVSRRLGHGSPAITLRLYGHLWSKSDDRAAAAIEKMLAGGDETGCDAAAALDLSNIQTRRN